MSAREAVDYAAIRHVLCHEHTEQLHERHVELLRQMCDKRAQGFYVSELQDVCEIIQIVHAKALQNLAVYEDCLCGIVDVCNRPLIEQKASELLRPTGLEAYTVLLSRLSQLLWLPSTVLRIELTTLIHRIAGGKLTIADGAERRSNQDEERPNNKSIALQLLRKSGAVATLAEVFMSQAKLQLSSIRVLNAQLPADAEASESPDHPLVSPSGDTPEISDGNGEVSSCQGELATASKLANVMIPVLLSLSGDDGCAKDLLAHGLINSVAMLLGVVAEANRKQLPDYVQILWNCCEALDVLCNRPSDENIPGEIIDFPIVISELISLFTFIQFESFRKSCKAIRNEVLIVLGLLARSRQAVLELLRCEGLQAIITYACAAEATSQWEGFVSPMASVRTFGTATDLDVELKELLWTLIIQVAAHNIHAANLLIAESPFVQVVLEYVAGVCHDGAPDAQSVALSETRSLNLDELSIQSPTTLRKGVDVTTQLLPTQVAGLQLLAMSVVVKVCLYCVEEFRRLDGVATLLSVISEHSGRQDENHRLMVEYALVALKQLVRQSKLIVDELVDGDAVGLVMSNYHDFGCSTRIRSLQFIVALSRTHRTQDVQSAFRDTFGVQALVDGLSAYCAKSGQASAATATNLPAAATTSTIAMSPGSLTLTSIQPQLKTSAPSTVDENPFSSDDEMLLVAVLECCWVTVVGNSTNEDVFLQSNGIDELLATFEMIPTHLRPQLLAFFSDLLDNPRIAPFVHGWKSLQTLRSFARLLCAAWIDEEMRLGCIRPDGIIVDLDHPLGSHVWDATDTHSAALSLPAQSPAFARLNEALQASRVVPDGQPHSNDLHPQRDIRCVVASVLEKLGYTRLNYLKDRSFSGANSDSDHTRMTDSSQLPDLITRSLQVTPDDLALTTADKQVMVLAKRYAVVREGEGWKALQNDLARLSVIPISSDAQVINEKLRESFQHAQAVQFEQMQLHVEGRSGLEAEEQRFFGQILHQREALEKQAILKSKMKVSSRSRKIEPRRPPRATAEVASVTESSVLSFD